MCCFNGFTQPISNRNALKVRAEIVKSANNQKRRSHRNSLRGKKWTMIHSLSSGNDGLV